MRSQFLVFCKLVVLLIALVSVMSQFALALTASQVYEQVKDSVVVIKVFDQRNKQVGLGSGVMLPSGDIVTNYHVVKAGVRYIAGKQIDVTKLSDAELEKIANGQPMVVGAPWIVHATLKAGDPDKDLCLLAAPGLAAEPARLGKATKLKVGDKVYAVGAPQGLELSLSEGIVSQLRGGHPPIIQTTAAVSPGSSGGGLFNNEGELVGITTLQIEGGQNLNFAVPVEWIGQVARGKVQERPGGEAPGVPEWGVSPKEGWENWAAALEKAQDWSGLGAWCLKWSKSEPGNYLAWFNLGFAYEKMGRHREAIEAWREAVRLKPDNAIAWFNLGVVYGNLGRHREAIDARREALRLKPDNAIAWNNLGFSYGEMGRYREAIEACREAVRLKPYYADAWFNLGVVYGKLGRNREAIDAYREAVRIKPDYFQAWYNLGVDYYQSGNRSAALEAVKELRRYDPQKADELFNFIMKP
jgi:Tfp pilus assembly protein PilF